MVWFGMVEWLVEESTMSSFAALIQITRSGHKKNLQCYGSVEIDIFSHKKNSGSNRQMVVGKKC